MWLLPRGPILLISGLSARQPGIWDLTFALVHPVIIWGRKLGFVTIHDVRLVCTERGLGQRTGEPTPSNLSDAGEGVSFPGQGLPERRESSCGSCVPCTGWAAGVAQGWSLNQVSRVCTPGLGLPLPPVSLSVSTLKAGTGNVSPFRQVPRRGGQGEVLPGARASFAPQRPNHKATGAPCPPPHLPASDKGPLGGGLPWPGKGLAQRATKDLQGLPRAWPPTLLA